jgi:succinate dehydrogenase/fumarate reductase flavoprotein subunit
MTTDHYDYDVIVIGTGAGGGTLAHRLAPSGKLYETIAVPGLSAPDGQWSPGCRPGA